MSFRSVSQGQESHRTGAILNSQGARDAPFQIDELHWLGQVVAGACGNAGDDVIRFAQCAEEDDRRSQALPAADVSNHRDAVQARHRDIRDDQVRLVLGRQFDAFDTVVGNNYVIQSAEEVSQDVTTIWLVFDDQDSLPARRSYMDMHSEVYATTVPLPQNASQSSLNSSARLKQRL